MCIEARGKVVNALLNCVAGSKLTIVSPAHKNDPKEHFQVLGNDFNGKKETL